MSFNIHTYICLTSSRLKLKEGLCVRLPVAGNGISVGTREREGRQVVDNVCISEDGMKKEIGRAHV